MIRLLREDIKKILPHREPMLLLDSVEFVDGISVGEYVIKGEEWFLQGHFPSKPIVPGVMLCEMMAQSSCMLMADRIDGKLTLFAGMDKVRFRDVAEPGDRLRFECELEAEKAGFFIVNAKTYKVTDGQDISNRRCCAEARLTIALK